MMRRYLQLLLLTALFLSLSCTTVVQAGKWTAPSTWDCGGDAFYMFEFEADILKGDLNGDDRITTADAIIALQITVSGEHDDNADMNGDGQVSSVDALMILQAA